MAVLQADNRHPTVYLLAAADTAMLALSLLLAFQVRAKVLPRLSDVWTGLVPLQPQYSILFVGLLPIVLGALYLGGAYQWPRIRGSLQIVFSVGRAFPIAVVGAFAFAYVLRDRVFSRAVVALALAFAFIGFSLVRLAVRETFNLLRLHGYGMLNAVVVGTGPAARDIADTISRRPYLGYKIAGFVSLPDEREGDPARATLGTVDELPQIVDRSVVDAVIFAVGLDEAARHEKTIWKLEEVGTTVHLRGDAVGVILSRTYIGEFEGTPILTLRSTPADPLALFLKRTIDVVGSGLGLLALSPVLAVAAAAVRFSSPGPVFFRQTRVGLSGRQFKMLKFRSMYSDAEQRQAELLAQNEMSGPVFKMTNDPRITPVGKWMRKFSVDELPQLWNVFVGDMSLVGPRPPIPKEVEQYERWQRRRLSMKPGITCLWQVGGRNEIDFDSWMKLDMEYIDNWSLGLDLKILLKTIPVVLLARGAR